MIEKKRKAKYRPSLHLPGNKEDPQTIGNLQLGGFCECQFLPSLSMHGDEVLALCVVPTTKTIEDGVKSPEQ